LLISKLMSKRKVVAVEESTEDKKPSKLEETSHEAVVAPDNNNGNKKLSGIIFSERHSARAKDRQRFLGNSSVANNDSKEIVSKSAPMYEWMISGADVHVIENEIRKDELKEREMMSSEDKPVTKYPINEHSSMSGRQQYQQRQLELHQQFSADVAEKRQQLVKDFAADYANKAIQVSTKGCIEQMNPDAMLGTFMQSASASSNKDALILERLNSVDSRIAVQQKPKGLDLPTIQENLSLQPTVRPAVLAAIENDMRGFSTPTAFADIRTNIMNVTHFFTDVWFGVAPDDGASDPH
jgi:hypothetical protein